MIIRVFSVMNHKRLVGDLMIQKQSRHAHHVDIK